MAAVLILCRYLVVVFVFFFTPAHNDYDNDEGRKSVPMKIYYGWNGCQATLYNRSLSYVRFTNTSHFSNDTVLHLLNRSANNQLESVNLQKKNGEQKIEINRCYSFGMFRSLSSSARFLIRLHANISYLDFFFFLFFFLPNVNVAVVIVCVNMLLNHLVWANHKRWFVHSV